MSRPSKASTSQNQTVSELVRILPACRDDPVQFAELVLGWTVPDRNRLVPYQGYIAGLVARYKTVVVPAGNSVGKTRLAAMLIAWWLLTRPNSRVVIHAPSAHLIGSVIFEELRRLHATAKYALGGVITTSPKASPQTWTLGPGWMAIGHSATTVERSSGQHDPNLLCLVDEASGISSVSWAAIYSLNAAKLVVFGNPLNSEGEFVKLFDRAQSELLKQGTPEQLPDNQRTVSHVVSSLDSPHANQAKSPIGLADANFIDEIVRRYGRDSLYFRQHIGLDKKNPFPRSSHDQMISSEWVDRCLTVSMPLGVAQRSLGLSIDVSKGVGRDSTVIMIGDIYGLVYVHRTNLMPIPEAVELVYRLAADYGVEHQYIIYDRGGWAGDEFFAHLKKRGILDARPYRGNDPGGDRHKNLRSRCAVRIRQRLDPDRPMGTPPPRPDRWTPKLGSEPAWVQPTQPGFCIPLGEYWADLRQELTGLRYNYELTKTALERKEDFAARLGRSPDLIDCLLQLFALFRMDDLN